MVGSCSAYGCKNRWSKDKPIKFHRFPLKKPELLKKWLAAVRRADFQPSKTSLLCGDHFTDDCYKTDKRCLLKDDAVPSIFCFTEQPKRKTIVEPKKELEPPSDCPEDAYWDNYEPLSPTSESIIRALNTIGVVHASQIQPSVKKEPEDSALPRVAVPFRIIQHLTRPQVVGRLNRKLTSPNSLNNTNSSYSTTASTSTATIHGSHSRPNIKKDLVLTHAVPLQAKQQFNRPQVIRRLNCKLTSPTSPNDTNFFSASTSTDTIRGSHSRLNKRKKLANVSLTHDVSFPVKRYLKHSQGFSRLKYKRMPPVNCLDKISPESTVTDSTSTDTIHGPHEEDAVLTHDTSQSVSQHLKYSQKTTGIETHDEDLTLQHLNNPQEAVDVETYHAASICDESLPVNQHLKYPQETADVEIYDPILTRDEYLPVNQQLNHPQETASIEKHDTSFPVNQPLNRLQETTGDRCEEFGKNVATKLQELPNEQRILCEKFINAALCKAKKGFLSRHHVLCKIKPSYFNYGYKARILARQIKSLSQNMYDSVESSK